MTPRNPLSIVTLLFVVSAIAGLLQISCKLDASLSQKAKPEEMPDKLVFLDKDFWPPEGCEEGFGSLVLELQPDTSLYAETIEIRGCVRVLVSGATMNK